MMAAARLLRQVWAQHARHNTMCVSAGLPGHLPQVPLTSLQSRHSFPAAAACVGGKVWQRPVGADLQHSFAAPAQSARSFAEQAMQDKASKPAKATAPKQQLGPASHARGGLIRAVFLSPNVLMEPYRWRCAGRLSIPSSSSATTAVASTTSSSSTAAAASTSAAATTTASSMSVNSTAASTSSPDRNAGVMNASSQRPRNRQRIQAAFAAV